MTWFQREVNPDRLLHSPSNQRYFYTPSRRRLTLSSNSTPDARRCLTFIIKLERQRNHHHSHAAVHQNAAIFEVAPVKISWWYRKRFKSYRVGKQTNRQTHPQTDKHTHKQINTPTNRQTHPQTDTTEKLISLYAIAAREVNDNHFQSVRLRSAYFWLRKVQMSWCSVRLSVCHVRGFCQNEYKYL